MPLASNPDGGGLLVLADGNVRRYVGNPSHADASRWCFRGKFYASAHAAMFANPPRFDSMHACDCCLLPVPWRQPRIQISLLTSSP